MAEPFTKLMHSMALSTIWQESSDTRCVWIAMLFSCNAYGEVKASVPGLAHAANVPLSACEEALRIFLSPDPYSRTPDFDGRRIMTIPGGWKLINHGKYRDEQSKELERARKRRYYEKHKGKAKRGELEQAAYDADVLSGEKMLDLAKSRGAAAKAMRENGATGVNPSHPDLQRLVDAGVETQVFADTARECYGKPMAYVLAVIKGRLQESKPVNGKANGSRGMRVSRQAAALSSVEDLKSETIKKDEGHGQERPQLVHE